MNMEGMRFQPEVDRPSASDVALIDRLLKLAVPDSDFDGAAVSLPDGKNNRTATPVEYSLSPDTLAACQRIAAIPGSEDLVATLVLRPLQRKLSPFDGINPAIVTRLGSFLNRIPSDRKMLATELFQKELAKISAERKRAGQSRPPPSEGRREESAENATDLGFLFATYRAKWLASGGHTDPSTFLGAPETLRKWASNADQTMRNTIDNPGDASNVSGTGHELFLGVEIADQNWMEANVIRVTAADDYANGIDLAIEVPYDPVLGIFGVCGFDFTTNPNEATLSHKLEKNDRGTRMNFFRSKLDVREGAPYEGPKENIPMVILGVNRDILSQVGSALRRGEKIGPEHPIKAILNRQAEIQIGLQIRTLATSMMDNALANMPRDAEMRRIVEEFAASVRADTGFLRNVSAVRDMVKYVSAEGMAYYLGRPAAERLRNLLAVHGHLEKAIAKTDMERPEVRRLAQSIKLNKAIASLDSQPSQAKISPDGEIFLRVARLGFLSQFARRVGLQPCKQGSLGFLGLVAQRLNRRDGLVRGTVGWGYLIVWLLGHRV